MARARARKTLDSTAPWPGFPKDATEWVEWIDQNEDTFREEMKVVRQGQHRSANVRAEAPQKYEPAARLEAPAFRPAPCRQAGSQPPPWLGLVSNGFFTLWRQEMALTTFIFACDVMRQQWCLVFDDPEELGDGSRAWRLPIETPLRDVLLPIHVALPASLLAYSGKVEVLKNEVTVRKYTPTGVFLQLTSSEVVAKTPRRRSNKDEGADMSGASDGTEALDSETDDEDDPDKDELWSAASSDEEMQANDADDGASEESAGVPEATPPGFDPSDAAEELPGSARLPRGTPQAPKGTHKVAWHSAYFTLTHDRRFDEIRMRVKPRWLVPAHMGTDHPNRSLRSSHFKQHEDPVRVTYLVLRAWALWRMPRNGFLHAASEGRQDAFRRECEDLRRELIEVGATANDEALSFLHLWAPPECVSGG
ncbi:MAG: hypothetical protein GY769_16960 [bacterium]|nr:hypothetical protein [bacterium]